MRVKSNSISWPLSYSGLRTYFSLAKTAETERAPTRAPFRFVADDAAYCVCIPSGHWMNEPFE
jgi:hypothetical protein